MFFCHDPALTGLRGCLKRVVPGIFRRQGTAKTLDFAIIILLHRYNLRLSLAFQTTSKGYSLGDAVMETLTKFETVDSIPEDYKKLYAMAEFSLIYGYPRGRGYH